jgi:hypothetical protein
MLLRIYIVALILIPNQNCIGQIINCNTIDSSPCYLKEKYANSNFTIEKKLENRDSIITMQTPILADMDGDCIPELIHIGNRENKILIIDSKTGTTKKEILTPFIDNDLSGIAIADVDNDGIPEIFFEAGAYSPNPNSVYAKLFCYSANGILKWASIDRVDVFPHIRDFVGGTPAVADFNQDGIPEVYVNNKIYNSLTGIKLADGGANGIGVEFAQNYYIDALSVAADLDEDTTDLELAAGYTVYKVIIKNPNGILGNSMTPHNIQVDNTYRDGLTTISDINLDGKLDIIVTSPGLTNRALVYVYTLRNGTPTLLAKAYPASQISTAIGPPVIGSIVSSGVPSILFTRIYNLFAYTYNGTTTLISNWNLNTSDSSGFTNLTMFDFNNDGVQEIILRDENNLLIVDGSSKLPKVIARETCLSGTWAENPIVGDVDNSGHAKICIPCGFTSDDYYGRITIFGSPDSLPGWAPARGIWNQYAYNPLQINDDLTVPRVQKNQATYMNGKYNNFMQQESYVDSNGFVKKPAASLTGKIHCINYDPLKNDYTITFDIYNRKDASAAADSNLAISFFNGDPTGAGTLIGHYYTLRSIYPGDSLLNLEFKFSAGNLSDLFMVINSVRNTPGTFGDQDFLQAECDYSDNISRTIDLPKIDSIHAMICKGSSYMFVDTSIVDAGKYYRKLSSVKGCDSLITILDLMTADTIYINQSIQTCDAYFWNHQTLTQTGIYRFDTINQFGCDSIVNLDLTIHPSNATNIRHTACNAYSWNGQTYDTGGIYLYKTKNSSGCDSTVTLELTLHHSDSNRVQIETCNSFVWNGRTYKQSGVYTLDTINQFGCDSVVQLNLSINSQINKTIVQTSCDAYQWNGRNYSQSGIYADTTQSSKGCDSITTLQLTIHKSNSSNTVHTTCDRYVWNGNTYTQSGTYTFQTQNARGCDSTATLQLTISNSSQSLSNRTSCDEYSWNNVKYTQSGTYPYKTINSSGCDSTAVLNLVIHKSDSLLQKQTACETISLEQQVTYTQSRHLYLIKPSINMAATALLL